MYLLTKYGNAKLQSLVFRRLVPKKPKKSLDATKTWVANLDPGTGDKLADAPWSAEVRVPDPVLDGRGSGSQWEVAARVSAQEPALLVITLSDRATGEVVLSFAAKASNGSATTAVEFTE